MVKRSILSLLMVGAALGTGGAAILSASFIIILGLSWWLALAALLLAAQFVVVAVYLAIAAWHTFRARES